MPRHVEPAEVDQRSERIQQRLELPMTVAALLVIPLLFIEGANYGEPWDTIGVVLNWGTWLAFLAEAAIMLSVVPDRWRWVRDNPIDVAVLLLTPPLLGAFAPARLLRLLRLVRLLRLGPAGRRLFSAEGLRYTALLAALTALVGGAAFASLEGRATGDGIYWAITTMTTVGYGDLQPTTPETKGLAIAVMLVGIGFVAVLTGAIAERFLAPDVEAIDADVQEELATDEAILQELRALSSRLAGLEETLARRQRRA